jgi:hypothetical protein
MKKLILLFLLVAVTANAQYNKTFQQTRCNADTANATTSAIGTPLQFYVAASSTYSFNFECMTTSSAVGGITYSIYYPSGATIDYKLIGTKKADTLATAVGTIDSSASALFNTNSSGTYPMTLSGTIKTGATKGIVMLVFTKPTSGTATIKRGSYGRAQKF